MLSIVARSSCWAGVPDTKKTGISSVLLLESVDIVRGRSIVANRGTG